MHRRGSLHVEASNGSVIMVPFGEAHRGHGESSRTLRRRSRGASVCSSLTSTQSPASRYGPASTLPSGLRESCFEARVAGYLETNPASQDRPSLRTARLMRGALASVRTSAVLFPTLAGSAAATRHHNRPTTILTVTA